MIQQVKQYILDNWDKTIREYPRDDGTLIGLPKSFTTPCASGMFQEMYYWDTYFTNVGLILSGRVDQAKNNVDNMIYLIEKYGKMPNGNRTYYLNRSQPPFLSQMVREVYDITGDTYWLSIAYDALEKEWDYWQSERITFSGLNHYAGEATTPEVVEEYGLLFCERAGLAKPEDPEVLKQYCDSMLALAESGWDCNSRFAMDAHKWCPVDLNSLMYLMEENMEYFRWELRKDAPWCEDAKDRRERMNRLMWNQERQVFCDYQYEKHQLGDVVSAAAFYPLFVGMATQEQADLTVKSLPLLECEFGVACCENRPDLYHLQWDYPHGWACLQYIVIQGLLKYGYREDALRIARKYVDTVARNFAQTGNLWEKYNVVTGQVSVTQEYETPPMMGWSAGVFLYCEKLLEEENQ